MTGSPMMSADERDHGLSSRTKPLFDWLDQPAESVVADLRRLVRVEPETALGLLRAVEDAKYLEQRQLKQDLERAEREAQAARRESETPQPHQDTEDTQVPPQQRTSEHDVVNEAGVPEAARPPRPRGPRGRVITEDDVIEDEVVYNFDGLRL